MARKDLSRTVIEGGRAYRNCWERRASHGGERASTRAWLDAVADDLDEADASAPPPIRRVDKLFHDKLGPAQRWLAAQAGRPWAAVYAELRRRFDARTIAGRHVVDDHLLRWVRLHPADGLRRHYHRFELYVDDHGILRKPAQLGRAYRTVRKEVEAWAARRSCALTCRGWWWFRREWVGPPCWTSGCTASHFPSPEGRRYHARRIAPLRPLSRGEIRYLERLTDDMKRIVVIASPWPAA